MARAWLRVSRGFRKHCNTCTLFRRCYIDPGAYSEQWHFIHKYFGTSARNTPKRVRRGCDCATYYPRRL